MARDLEQRLTEKLAETSPGCRVVVDHKAKPISADMFVRSIFGVSIERLAEDINAGQYDHLLKENGGLTS
ncbi:hypothetical protein LJC56_10065 [Christensenellaceae bacterium OttesenSCG-928-K19]|nr:hypothetical protein [Christensenellaceae bacterium OttesenSCG-928-K19]